MALEAPPLIKGVYVMSHIHALRKQRGEAALNDLLTRLAVTSLGYDDSEMVPVSTEVKILETIVDIIDPRQKSDEERSLEAGRLHFRNFTNTWLWKLMAPFVALNLHAVLMRSHFIAGRVFQGVTFISRDAGPNTVRVTMLNNDYPIEHFKGFFEAFVTYAGFKPHVEARQLGFGVYEYTIVWLKK